MKFQFSFQLKNNDTILQFKLCYHAWLQTVFHDDVCVNCNESLINDD